MSYTKFHDDEAETVEHQGDEFAELMARLPSELIQRISDFFLTPGNTTIIDDNYRPPVQLQICRGIRNEFADKYFRDSVFQVGADAVDSYAKWASALHPTNGSMIRIVYFEKQETSRRSSLFDALLHADTVLSVLVYHLYAIVEERQAFVKMVWTEEDKIKTEWINSYQAVQRIGRWMNR